MIDRVKPMKGVAEERIPYGASVLCRCFKVTLAGPDTANGVARKGDFLRHAAAEEYDGYYEPGEFVIVDPVVGLDGRDLKAIAAGPLMDPNRLYLPAGRISEAEYRERERRNLTVAVAP